MNDQAINFKTRESVKVKEGIMCPDLEGLCIGGWQGRISEIVFDSEDETSVLMEFALNERGSGKTVVENYREKVGGENDKITSLFWLYLSR